MLEAQRAAAMAPHEPMAMAMSHASVQIARVLGAEFLQYMPHVLPPLLAQAADKVCRVVVRDG